MTGNTKVWRAPLAGLASVAMIATMGVAASTANAAPASVAPYNFTVTFDANKGGEVNSSDTDSISTQDYRGADTILSDGYLTDSEISANFPVTPKADNVFTGWYTAPTGGEKWDEGTFINKDTTLYAHYAERGQKVTITFQGSGEDGNKTVEVSKDDNKLASWELPTDQPGDHAVVTGWHTVAGSSVDPGIDLTADDLTKNITAKLGANTNGVDQILKLEPNFADATSVRFKVQGEVTKTVDVAWNSSIDLPTGAEAYSHTSQVRATSWIEQGDNKVTGKLTASEGKNTLSADDGWWDVKSDGLQTAFEVTYYTEINGFDRPFAKKIVDEKATAPKDAPAARNTPYTFAYYTEGANNSSSRSHSYSETEFTKPVVADTALAAQWATKDVTVTFDLNYGDKKLTKNYQKGDTFTLPTSSEATRNGWTLLGWYTDKSTGANPFGTGANSEFSYSKFLSYKDPVLNNKIHTPGWYDANYKLPANARLRINNLGQLEYENTVASEDVDPSTGKPVYKTKWETIPSTLYAAWQRSDKNEVSESINSVPTTDSKGDYITDNEYYKLASWTAYRAEIEDIQAELAKPGLTNAQYADLLARVQAAQAKLEAKTDQKVYRLYNKQTGDHYLTANLKEYDALKTLGLQGEGWKFTAVSAEVGAKLPAAVVTPLYSVYNQNTGEHLLVFEKEASDLEALGWQWDNGKAPVFYAPNAGASEAVRRVYNPNTNLAAHLYTAEAKEFSDLTSWGWKADNDGKALFNLDAAK